MLDFTGTAGQVRQTFQVAMHHLQVNGETHIANMNDPQVPAELAGVIAGIVSLNDFRPQKMVTRRSEYSPGNGQYPVVPADLWTIYNFLPAYAKGYSGQGQTIAVIEDSDLYSTADWSTFRSAFGLASTYPGAALVQVNPSATPVNNCVDPGVNTNDDEAILDAEWATAAAPSATIEVASCLDTATGFGGFIALQNLLNSSSAPPAIVSISYGQPEPSLGATYNAYINSLYEQAVAEGVSIFVSSGDSGAASADRGAYAEYGINVSGFTSTPYNVSVGGTDFADTYQGDNGTYWNAANAANYGSALSYLPEIPWNDSCASVLLADSKGVLPTYGSGGFCSAAETIDHGAYLNTIAGGGGPSSCSAGVPPIAYSAGGSCSGYPKPAWQSGLIGNPSDGVRDIPDVSLFAGNGIWNHYYPACFTDPSNGGKSCGGAPETWSGYGGTSIAAPIWAGIQSLVNQASASRWGNPNPTYYALAADEYGSSGSSRCASSLGNQIDNGCVFNDVTQIPLLYGGAGMGGETDLPCGWQNCYQPSGDYGVLSTAPQAINYLYLTSLGSGYGSAPVCSISGGGGTGAACAAALTGVVSSATLTNQGSGYTSYPTCTLTGGGGTGAACSVGLTLTNASGSFTGWVSSIGILSYGTGYTSAPTCTISGGGGTGAACSVAIMSGVTISLTALGSGYTTMPSCTLTGGGGSGAACIALGTSDSNAYQPAFKAGVGWDFTTGIGTVNASNLVDGFATFAASVSPAGLAFQPQAPRTTSASQTVTLTNTGTAALSILPVALSGTDALDFATGADTCSGNTLPPSGSCTVKVTFTPNSVGIRSASLDFTDAARRSQNSVTLSGTGTGAGVSVSPAAIVFPTQIVGASGTQTVTLTNPGTLALALNSIAIQANSGGVFSQTNSCGPTLQPESQCAISVVYTSTEPGSATASLQVTDSALDSPQTVGLTGSSAVPVPLINQALEPASMVPGGQEFTLTVTGTGFAPSATMNWNGAALATTYVSSKKLHASVPAADIASRGSASVTVANPGAASASNAILFPVGPDLATPTFVDAPVSPIAAGTQPQSAAVGDFRGIGRSDLAVANIVSDTVTVLLSNGDGTFTPAASSPILVGVFPASIAAGDFNGDGKLDLVTANFASGNLTILLSNGDGTFTPTAESPAAGSNPGVVVTGDFNGDGNLDLAVSNGPSNGVRILLGNGDGTFTPVAAVSATGSSPSGIAVGDFNGDGRLDLAIANEYSKSVTVLLGNGDGTFTAAASPSAGTYSLAIAAGDFNGDGILDLAVANAGDNNLTVLLGKGDGTFQAAASPAAGAEPWGIAEADFNGDGNLDLAVVNVASSDLSILLGNGDGTFTPSASSPFTGFGPSQVAIGDFNGDGLLDLATPNSGANNISVLLQVQPALSASVSPAALAFPSQIVGTSSSAESITLSNSGTAALAINSIALGGANAGDFAQTNTCGGSVAAGGSCSISVTFTPGAAGARNASVSVSDNASGSPQIVPVSGTGTTVSAALLPATLTFPSQIVGTSSAAESITLSNSGTAALTINSIAFGGANAGDFTQTNTCGGSVAAGASCTISVIFTPGAGGARSASVSVSDNASGSPQKLSLAGMGVSPDFTIQASPLSPSSIVAGQSGTSMITITSLNGFNGAVTPTCSGLPAGVSCSFSPNPITPTGNGIVIATAKFMASSSTSAGTSNVTITGTAGSNSHGTPVALTILAAPVPDLTVSAGAVSPSTVSEGQSATSTISITSVNGFNSAVSLTCSVSPTPSLMPGCSFSSNSVTPAANGTVTSTLSISTSAATASLPHPSSVNGLPLFYALSVPVPGIWMLGAAFGSRSRRRKLRGFPAAFVLLAGIAFLSGCGGGVKSQNNGSPGTPAGSYTVTVDANGGSGITHSATVTLTVQ